MLYRKCCRIYNVLLFGTPFSALFAPKNARKKNTRKPVSPLIYWVFPCCRNYNVWAHVRDQPRQRHQAAGRYDQVADAKTGGGSARTLHLGDHGAVLCAEGHGAAERDHRGLRAVKERRICAAISKGKGNPRKSLLSYNFFDNSLISAEGCTASAVSQTTADRGAAPETFQEDLPGSEGR